MSELLKRVIAAVILAAIAITAMVWSPKGYFVLALLLSVLLISEYTKITAGLSHESNRAIRMHTVFRALLSASAFILLYLYARYGINYLAFLLLYPALIMLTELFNAGEKSLLRILIGNFSLLWIVMPVSLSVFLVFPAGQVYDSRIFIGVLLLIWANDVFAYFIGKYLGKHQLAKRISPQKSIEGALGGAIAALAISFFMFKLLVMPDWFDWPALSLLISFFTVTGDLIESLIKRNIRIKDSGSLIPGHGGLLDRFDSLLFSLIPVFIYLLFRNIIHLN